MPESIQHKLDRVRRPRVQITYDVETLGSIVKTELPFVVGIMADLSGDTEKPDFKERKFVEIDRDNFDKIMEKIAPTVTVNGDPLDFKTLEDFNPINVLLKTSLRAKFESRTRLSNLLAKLDGNPKLQHDLVKAIAGIEGDDKAALEAYMMKLHPKGGDGVAAKKFDADALLKDYPGDQKALKARIVEKYPDTITPDVSTLATAVNKVAEDKNTLITHILKEYPYVATNNPAIGDPATLAAAITDVAKKNALYDKLVAKYPQMASLVATTPAPADRLAALTASPSLDADQKSKLQLFIAREQPETITGDVTALVDALFEEDKDEVKGYISSNFDLGDDIKIKEASAGLGKNFPLATLLKSLSAADKKEVEAYINAQKDAAREAQTGGGTNQ
jgi:type VI secretion system protein ImpB